MRLLARTIWRAFPELDRFDDERCRQFVARAVRGKGWFASVFRAVVAFSAGIAVASAGTALAALLGWQWLFAKALPGSFADSIAPILAAGTLIAAWGLAGLTGMVVRDQLFRRRLARFIRARGRCPRCRYTLLGLPVPDSLWITCPECGMDLEVDEALTELAEPPAAAPPPGAPHADPSAAPRAPAQRRLAREPDPPRWIRWLTPARRRLVSRASIAAALAVFLGAAGWLGYREWFIRRQAAVARTARVGFRDLLKLSESLNPPDDGSPDAWDLLAVLQDIQSAAELEAMNGYAAETGVSASSYYCDYSELIPTGPAEVDDDRRSEDRAAGLLARRAIARMDELGWDDALSEFLRADRAVMLRPAGPVSLMGSLLPYLSQCRRLAQANAGRMNLAVLRSDQAAFLRCLDANLIISRMLERDPYLISRLVAISINAITFDSVRRTALNTESSAWSASITAELNRLPCGTVPFSIAFEYERLMNRDGIAEIFSNTQTVRWGGATLTWGGGPGVTNAPGRLGTYEENLAALDQRMASLKSLADTPRWARPAAPAKQPTGLRVLDALQPAWDRCFRSADFDELQSTATAVVLALERYRLAHGRYPQDLLSLVPDFLPTHPLDPVNGRPFGYRTQDPLVDPWCRGYLLYSYGADAEDNGGTPPPGTPRQRPSAKDYEAAGYDFVLTP